MASVEVRVVSVEARVVSEMVGVVSVEVMVVSLEARVVSVVVKVVSVEVFSSFFFLGVRVGSVEGGFCRCEGGFCGDKVAPVEVRVVCFLR